MDITLFMNTSQHNVVNKQLSHEKTIENVFLLEECDVIKPSLIFAKTDDTIFDTYNYVFIPKFNRYYYGTIRLLDGERYQMNCEVDVLMSFKNDILNSEIIPQRTGTISKVNKFIVDERVKNSTRANVIIRKFENYDFLTEINPTNYSTILTVLR